MKDHYSFIAYWYSDLSKFVFGTTLKDCKLIFFNQFEGKKILILGGGDGLDYTEMQQKIDGEYWELSKAMLFQARKNLRKSGLTFHFGNFKSEQKFDLIWLPFVLDTIPNEELESLLVSFKNNLKSDGQVFLSDFFEPVNLWQKAIHRVMILFFRLTTGHRRSDIPDYKVAFEKEGYELLQEKKFLKGWVRSQLWKLTCSF